MITDSILQKAFQTAYFICQDREVSRQITFAAVERLTGSLYKQYKRLYYKPTQTSYQSLTHRHKVILSEPALLQRLVFLTSEVYEKQVESNGNGLGEARLIVHFIKHLVMISMGLNSFHMTIGIARTLYNYSTREAVMLYELLLQNSHPPKDEAYWRERKAWLMSDLKERFGDLLQMKREPNREIHFEAYKNSEQWIDLVEKCLRLFAPWGTSCPLPESLGIRDLKVDPFVFSGYDLDQEHPIEILRMHALIHPECFSRLVDALECETPWKRLQIPRFFLTQDSVNNHLPDPDYSPTTLNESELKSIRRILAQ